MLDILRQLYIIKLSSLEVPFLMFFYNAEYHLFEDTFLLFDPLLVMFGDFLNVEIVIFGMDE